jgi:zinc transporter ZupT
MNEIRWMAGAGVGCWLAATVIAGRASGTEVLFGMLGPLAAVIGSWAMVDRTHRVNPEQVMAVMIAGFAAKMVFFGVYVAVMLKVLALRPVPFVASFIGFFLGLYAMEARYLRRLFARGTV